MKFIICRLRNINVEGLIFIFLFNMFVLNSAGSADPLDNWHWRNPLPQGNSLNSVAYGNNIFAAVGQCGTILTSNDGIKWSVQRSGVNVELKSITYGNNIFAAVSWNGKILTSRDGINWSCQSLGIYGYFFYSITFGNNMFVIVGQFGTIYTSSDGVNWTSRSLGKDKHFVDAAYGNNTFVIVGRDENGSIAVSGDGINWSSQNLATNKYLTNITFSNSTFVAVSDSTGGGENDTIFTSVDGSKWSDDGGEGRDQYLVWRQLGSVYTNSLFKDIIYGNNIYVAVGSSGKIFTSGDGVKWSGQSSGINDDLRNITYGNSTFVAVGNDQTSLISKDGINWVSQSRKWRLYGLNGIAYGNNIFAAVGSYGITQILGDTFNWSYNNDSGIRQSLYAVTYGNNMFAAVGNAGTILTSPDGVNWVTRISGTGSQLTGIAYGNNIFVAAGWDKETRGGIILTSFDGIIWKIQNFEKGNFFRFTGVAYGNNLFVAAGDGKIFTSEDGIKWSGPRIVNAFFNSITFGNNIFAATGGDREAGSSIIITSVDAVNWKRRRLGTNNGLYGITYGNNTFVVVGIGGTILQSDDLSGSQYEDVPLSVLSYVYPKPVRLSNEFKIKIIFNKTIDINFPPKVILIGSGRVAPLVEKGGELKTTFQFNDTYITPEIILNESMAGDLMIAVSDARDMDGNIIKNIAEEAFDLKPEKGFNLDKQESIIIKEGDTIFSPRINIEFNVTDAEEMMLTEDVTFKTAVWEPFNSSKTFTLSDNEGKKIIYFKFKDKDGRISVPVVKTADFIIAFHPETQKAHGGAAVETAKAELQKETNEAMETPALPVIAEPEKKIIYSEEFWPKNREYSVSVGYEKGGGGGGARYIIKNKKGEIINKFFTDIAPNIVIAANNGERFIAFGGNWDDAAYLDKMCFYNAKGELIKKHISEINLNGKVLLSENSRYFAITYGLYNKSNMILFDALTGEKLWDIKTDINITELEMSRNGEWLLASGSLSIDKKKEENNFKKYKIYLIDNSGKIYWQKEEVLPARPGGSRLLVEINEDGTVFAIKERGSKVINGKKGVRERHIYVRSTYKNTNGSIMPDKIQENIYEPETP